LSRLLSANVDCLLHRSTCSALIISQVDRVNAVNGTYMSEFLSYPMDLLILLGRTLTVTSLLSVTRETLFVATFYDSGGKVVDASSSCSDPTDIDVGKTPSFEIILVEAGRAQRVDSMHVDTPHSPNWGHIHAQPGDPSSSGEKCSENSFVGGAGSRFFP